MSRARRRLAPLVLMMALTACKTAAIPTFDPIEIPPGFSSQLVELAIVSGILNKPPPPEFDPTKSISEEQFQKLLWEHFFRDAHGRSWFPESRAPGVIYASVNTRGYYLRVVLTFDQSSIQTHIVASENLSQSDSRIHKRALQWIARLHDHIRREIGRLSLSVRGR